MADLIQVNMGYYDLMEQDDEDDTLYEYADWLRTQCEDYEGYDTYGIMSDLLAVEHFTNPTFNDLLRQWFEERGQNMEEEIRGYMPDCHGGFYMHHGFGYSIWSSDLLGGRADGEAWREFNEWLRRKGFWCEG